VNNKKTQMGIMLAVFVLMSLFSGSTVLILLAVAMLFWFLSTGVR